MLKSYRPLFVLLLAFPATAFAASGGEAPGLSSLAWPVTNFVIFLGLATYLYKTKIAKVVEARSDEIRAHLAKAKAELTRAEERLSEVNARLQAVETEKAAVLERFEEEGRRMGQSIVDNAYRTSDRIVQDAKRQIENEIAKARKELRQDAVRYAIDEARRRLESEMTDDKDRDLRKKALAEALF